MADYNDGSIQCDSKDIRIRAYYFPWGTKVIPYSAVKGVRRVTLGTLRGKLRVWGTANMKYWANLDTKRPSKGVGLILDTGRSVKPFITPEDDRSRACRAGSERRLLATEPISLDPR
jgi:hypothetical protein